MTDLTVVLIVTYHCVATEGQLMNLMHCSDWDNMRWLGVSLDTHGSGSNFCSKRYSHCGMSVMVANI